MPAKTQNMPLSRLDRISIGLGLKASSSAPQPPTHDTEKHAAVADEDWYIPYNGPYEQAPVESPRRLKERDSWGDLIHREEDNDTVLADQELYNRYGGHDHSRNDHSHPAAHGDAGGYERERKGRSRDRAQSVMSSGTVPSTPIAHKRKGTVLRRRSAHANANTRRQVPSYMDLDAAGGVGESPMPIQRTSYSSGGENTPRTSRGSFFAFGSSGKKAPHSPSRFSSERGPDKRSAHGPTRTKPTTASDRPLSTTESPLLRQSSSSEWNRNNPMTRARRERTLASYGGVRGSGTTDEEDYYNSYYSTLITMTAKGNSRSHFAHADPSDPPRSVKARRPPPTPDKYTTPAEHHAPSKQHPYAYVFPSAAVDRTHQVASPFPTTTKPKLNDVGPGLSNSHHRNPPQLTLISPPENPRSAPLSQFAVSRVPAEPSHALKNSASTPNLRSTNRSPQGQSPLPKARDHWLSAVTWCDALIFPRPRLRMREEDIFGSGRIISPPNSPLRDTDDNGSREMGGRQVQQGIESRVLAHSRSLADLANAAETSSSGAGPSVPSNRVITRARGATLPSRRMRISPPPIKTGGEAIENRGHRPKSFAQDDLALLSPVPSLARVLEEGQLLEHRRKKWQIQASESFQNKRSRSFSRARSKSLTYKQGRRKENETEKAQSALDFLAARSFLGNQALMPVVSPPTRKRTVSYENTSSRAGRPSHSHSNSLAKSLSKSSKTTSRGHSRNDSWSKSAFKVAKSTAALCGFNSDAMVVSSLNEKSSSFEGISKEEATKTCGLADSVDQDVIALNNAHPPGNGVSPSPSGISDTQIGIAVTTAPQVDEPAVDRKSIRLLPHPYAQGGLYTFSHKASEQRYDRGLDYAAPHRSPNITDKRPGTHDGSMRHRPPTQTSLLPYALASRDSYQSEAKIIPYPRIDSNVPPSSKMWAMSSGVVQEVLPNEIQYSPCVTQPGSPPSDDVLSQYGGTRNSNMILDMVGVGETLAYAVRRRRSQDSGVGSNDEDLTITQAGYLSQVLAEAGDESMHVTATGSLSSNDVHRKPVQYDCSRPCYLQTPQRSSDPTTTTHPFASSSAPERLSPPNLRLSPPPSAAGLAHSSHSSPGVPSQSSSPQLSPRPLGSVDDLDHFHDLFYKPNMNKESSIDIARSSLPSNPGVPCDVSLHSRRTASGLTSLARQLSQEFGELNAQRQRSSSNDSSSGGSSQHQGDLGVRTTTDTDLQFVFSDIPQTTSQVQSDVGLSPGNLLAFHPSLNLPEDVGSWRTSSVMEVHSEDDETALFRLGQVESVTTPPAVSSDRRMSEHLSLVDEHTGHHSENTGDPGNRLTSHSSLRPPTLDHTRTSYTTSSTGSRISGLSDFPVPPTQEYTNPAHISLLNPYFDEASADRDSSALSVPRPSSSSGMISDQEGDVEGPAAPLSSHS